MKDANANSCTLGIAIPTPKDKELTFEQKEAIKEVTAYLEKTGSLAFKLEQNREELYEKYIKAYKEAEEAKKNEEAEGPELS